MKLHRSIPRAATFLVVAGTLAFAQAPAKTSKPVKTYPPDLVKAGETLFIQQCAFCHGRDTGGGEDGPDLTRSKLVGEDADGSEIGPVVRNGRDKMPRFTVTDQELAGLSAFIHTQRN